MTGKWKKHTEFQMKMQVNWFKGYCIGEKYKKQGSWDEVTFDIEMSEDETSTIRVDETNAEGIGISHIELSPVELTIYPIETQEQMTFAVVLDKDGKKLISGSGNAYELSINGHDMSEFTIYIYDYDKYIDEIKVQALENGENNWRELLEEHSIFKKMIEID